MRRVLQLGYIGFASLLTVASATAVSRRAPQALAESFRAVADETSTPQPHLARVSRRQLLAEEESAEIEFEIPLRLRNVEELQARVAAGEVIPAAEMAAKYLPLPADADRMAQWLSDQGLSAAADASGRAFFGHAAVRQLRTAFGTDFARVAYEGGEYTSAVTAPSVPADLSGLIVGVNGLQPHLRLKRHLRSLAAAPDSLSSSNPPYTPAQIAAAYGANGLAATGTGQTIAIVGETTPAVSDLTTFWGNCGIAQTAANVTTIQVVAGTLPASSSNAGTEATLDVEWASALAPAATIRVYATVDGNLIHFDQAYARILSDLTANPGLRQVSISYGAPEQTGTSVSQLRTDDQYFLQLAAAGVSVFASSGDGGSNPNSSGQYSSTATLQVESPACDPNVTAVGGTSLALNPSGTSWSDTAWVDGGGGVSAYVSRPSWQTGTGVPAGGGRLVPDVASAGDPHTGAYVIWNGSAMVVGGTSWSAPTWAGFCALINQSRSANGLSSIGLLNPKIYPLMGSTSFRDVVAGNNGAYTAAVGYDECTGVGVPQIAKLMVALGGNAAVTSSPGSGATPSPGSSAGSGAGTGSGTPTPTPAPTPTTSGTPPAPVVVAPAITAQPASLAVAYGGTAKFAVAVTGTAPFVYQWYKNSAALPGASAPSLTLANVQPSDAGSYKVSITNSAGTATSGTATLAVNTAPVIVSAPASQIGIDGAGATLSVAASGPGLAYQWQFNGVDLTGATSSTLNLSNLSTAQAGVYSVRVSNASGSVTVSALVAVEVNARMVNLSSRAAVDPANAMMAGFVVSGSTPKEVLLRAVGPGLSAFGIANPLAQPSLMLNSGAGDTLDTAAAWDSSPMMTAMFDSVGAFPLAAGSADAAMVEILAPGTYTTTISGKGGAGIALAEIYDEDPTWAPSQLVNLSSRANVGAGVNAMTAGFVIAGSSSETVLIRAIGPGLRPFGIVNALATPTLTVFDGSGAVIATNTGWGAALAPIFSHVGAFALAPGSADCAVLLNLPAGAYTVQMSGLGGATGSGLVEVYDVR